MDVSEQPAAGLAAAIQAGGIGEVSRLLAEHPGLAAEQFTGRAGRTKTALHLVTEWPGYFPGGPQVVPILIAAGGDLGYHPGYADETAVQVAADRGTQRSNLLEWLTERAASAV